MTNTNYGDRIAWIDVETTSLRFENRCTRLLEVGVAITNIQLDLIAVESAVIRHEPKALFFESDWDDAAVDMHFRGEPPLTELCAFGVESLPLKEAEDLLLCFLVKHTKVDLDRPPSSPGTGSAYPDSPLWGGCSPLIDRMMIRRDMPRLYERIHYRTLDASSLREALKRWAGRDTERAHTPHRALDDAIAAAKLANVFRKHLLEEAGSSVLASRK